MATTAATRIPKAPALTAGHLLGRRSGRAQEFLARGGADHVLPYGFGKVAFRDAIRAFDPGPDANVLLPGYVPDGVVESIREAGATPRFYAIERDLGPDLADVASKLDDGTVAATVVHYFGFPAPRFDAFRQLTANDDVPVVTDNAHATFSRDGDRLLGTRGAVGFTSLRKTLPVPNGAFLFVNDPERVAVDAATLAGRATDLTPTDYRFAAESILSGAKHRHAPVDRGLSLLQRLEEVRSNGNETAVSDNEAPAAERDPAARFRRARVPMTALADRVLDRVDPSALVGARRDAFRAWRDGLAPLDGVQAQYVSLSRGVAPQVFPAVAEDPDAFLARLRRSGVVGAHTWPPLPATVRENDEFETANDLAERLVAIPAHQEVDPASVRAVCADL
jgi:dTDP-4-amino-4,6-dideoxygalactose transaminase